MRMVRNSRHRSTTFDDQRRFDNHSDQDLPGNISEPSHIPQFSSNHFQPLTVKLPPIQIHKFSGKLTEWPEFKATCESIFNDIRNEIQRFRCLKSYLEGEPFRMIQHLQANEYRDAWTILGKRYDNERAIVNEHIRELIQLPVLINESAESLKNMLNTTNECVAALQSYKIATDSWDAILIYLLSQRLDSASIKHWEEKIDGSKTIPRLSLFTDFLEVRINILEITASQKTHSQSSKIQKVMLNTEVPRKCTICQGNHFAYVCAQLINKPNDEKMSFIQEKKLCANCFHPHETIECKSRFSCKICKQRHNSVLHESATVLISLDDDEQATDYHQEELQALEMAETCLSIQLHQPKQVILATAVVKIEYENKCMLVKALIDQGSTTDLISKKICQALDLPEISTSVPITGVCGQVSYNVNKRTSFMLRSMVNKEFMVNIEALVVPRIATLKPTIPQTEWKHLSGLQLADPQSHATNRIDILLGASTFARIILSGLSKGENGQPMAQNTELGWIISGNSEGANLHQQVVPVFTLLSGESDNDKLALELRRFWEVESIPKQTLLTPQEQMAEQHFKDNLQRGSDGRFIVKLPFKNDSTQEIGNSFPAAKRRFISMTERFASKPDFRIKYDQCLQEYVDLNQMELTRDLNIVPKYFLPHHPIVMESRTTTKIRPVFDASCRTNLKRSLNSELLIGPTIQPKLFSQLIKFRKFKFSINGDIEKMYRQVWIHPDDYKYQCILWQPDHSSELKSYALKTVTFGVASAPFLAIRSLYQIGEEIKSEWPDLAEKIQTNFYVDDYFDSAETSQEAQIIMHQTTGVLAKYGFSLKKWKSNESDILSKLSDSEKDTSPCNTFKTLGVQWHSESDCFVFVPFNLISKTEWTKRSVLSEVCKLFDPLGWLSPCIILAKIFIQKLWLIQVGWDEQLPPNITEKWEKIRVQFVDSCPIKIPRWIGLSSTVKHASLQGFADASEKAYGCVVYLRLEHEDGTISITQMAAKTRVAPLKKLTIPRLELLAALLLSELTIKIKDTLQITSLSIQVWSDSAITLYWIADHPSRWKTYVANRISEIQAKLPSHHWRHIESALNPADCASRGLEITKLEQFKLWWKGPEFLSSKIDQWPARVIIHPDKISEERRNETVNMTVCNDVNPIISRFSKFNQMIRVIALCLRWLNKVRSKEHKPKMLSTTFTVNELQTIETKLILATQKDAFAFEIDNLSKKRALPNGNRLLNLDPFVDSEGILRVGGRIQKSSMSENEKHPIILPSKHNFTHMLIEHAHSKNLHGGTGLTLNWIRKRYWIINGRQRIKSVIFRCVNCFQYRKKLLNQKMGNLPEYRLQSALPFTFTGVDYAGYFEIKTSNRKNAPFTKAYIALFICLTTRAVHLELVSDLTTTQFLKAFKRFIGRRGIPSKMFSDNGSNFVGAEREIKESFQQAYDQQTSEFNQFMLENQIEWKTIPARAPHFGGWESAVKLTKHHLKRVLKNVRLNFEDFNTFIIQVEAVVNSRPLWENPTSMDEIEALTPAHFLIFRPVNMLPEPNLNHLPLNRLNQYQFLQRLLTDFWKTWSTEYLQNLQIRKKWQKTSPNLSIGQIVLVSEDNEPPSRWSLGRVTKIFKGTDDLVRVAEVKCRGKLLRRPIHKLSLLPISDNYNGSTD